MRESRTHRERRVLLIEDDFTLEPVFEKVLHEIDPNIEMEVVPSGEDALDRLDVKGASQYSLVIADIFLEGKITGVDLCSLIQNIYPTMPILVVSALPQGKYFDFLGTQTVSPPYLEKPFRFSEAKTVIRDLLN